jgi:hypothetical protein
LWQWAAVVVVGLMVGMVVELLEARVVVVVD